MVRAKGSVVVGISGLLPVVLGCSPSPETQRDSRATVRQKDLADTQVTLQPTASAASDRFGRALASGDFNDDSYPDLVVSAPGLGSGGLLYLYEGTVSGLDLVTEHTFSTTGSIGLGYGLSAGGDVNGDGVEDLAATETGDSTQEQVYLFLGSTTAGLVADQAIQPSDWVYGDSFKVPALGADLDGDGYGDLAVGALTADATYTDQGAVYVYYGSATGVVAASELKLTDQANPWTSAYYGTAVAMGPDSDGDGYDELYVGRPWLGTSAVYIYNGSTTGVSASSYASLTGNGTAVSHGGSISFADIDGDGLTDLLVGDQNAGSYGSVGGGGQIYTYFGSATGYSDTNHQTAGSCYYRCDYAEHIAGLGDVDGDGYGDALASYLSTSIGSSGSTAPSFYLHYGTATGLAQSGTLLDTSGGSFGNAWASEDFDGDGLMDPALGWFGQASWSATDPGWVNLYTGSNRTWYPDLDGDGYGDESAGVESATPPSGYIEDGTDCDDSDASTYPGATEVVADGVDNNCDGYEKCKEDRDQDGYAEYRGEVTSSDLDCTDPGEGDSSMPRTDCDDGDASINPGATDHPADGIDQDCDGQELCYEDLDGDGFGTDAGTTLSSADLDCEDSGESGTDDDCDDSDASIHPDATEGIADGVDQDCDGIEFCYTDADGDGHSALLESSDDDCDDAGESYTASGSLDCDDSDASVYPGAAETVGDGIDQDCDDADACYVDLDGDGYGDGLVDSNSAACSGSGEALVDGDCDDADASVNPGATEAAADGVDQDCDGFELCYLDSDGDGYAAGDTVADSDLACGSAGSATVADQDCDDSDPAVNPAAAEIAGDGVDQDCDGTEDCYDDADGDGVAGSTLIQVEDLSCGAYSTTAGADCDDSDSGAFPGATEAVADGVDQDCDGGDTCYADGDGDGFVDGTVSSADLDCTDSGEAASSSTTDCDDASVYPGAPEAVGDGVDSDCDSAELCYVDADGDGYRVSDTVSDAALDCSSAGSADATAPDGDCDDLAAAIHPGATEVLADGTDSDCDGLELCWVDDDGDGFQAGDQTLSASLDCSDAGIAGSAAGAGDCDDTDPAIHPGATEGIGDGVDSDCDGGELCYVDADSDGYHDGITAAGPLDCGDAGLLSGSAPGDDCDDSDAAFHPGADESDCTDPNDYNCDGSVQYADDDSDGWPACTECDDQDPDVHPDADELCDGIDNDCDGTVDNDDALDAGVWYEDGDGDGFGLDGYTTQACLVPSGYSELPGDCEDTDPTIHPDALEVCGDGVDNDCDGAGGPDDDEDGDTLSWTQEQDLGTDPCDPDTDDDGRSDADDRRPVGCEGCASSGSGAPGGWMAGVVLLGVLLRRHRRA